MTEKRDIIFTPAEAVRTLHIHLPQGYYDTDERYPVMYYFDGHNLFSDADATYGKSWGLEEFLNQWEKPIIVVGIECGHAEGERLREYCPYHVEGGWLGEIFGTGDETVRWMAEQLKPMIDREYRTWPFREATGIAGSSMGGLMSLYAVTKYNAVFSKAGCLSSSLLDPHGALRRDITESEIDPDTRIYLSWGTEEGGGRMAAGNEAVARLLTEKGANVRLYCQQGGRHCEADWEKQNPLYLDFLWLDR